MNRWIHAGFAALALLLVVCLVVFWPRPDDTGVRPPLPAPSSGLPPPTGTPPTLAPTDPTSPCVAPPTQRLRVATINIHGAVGPDGYDLPAMADEIRAWDADVVLLQEVHRFRAKSGLDDQPAELGQLLSMDVVFGRNFTRPPESEGGPRRESGTATLSRLPILSWSNQLLPNFPGLQQRGLLRATIDLPGGAVDVYNAHFQHTRGVIRIVQARGVRKLVAGNDRPFLLGGDLNAESGSPAMQVIDTFTSDPWPLVGVGEGLTVPPRVPQRRIDFVLYGTGGWVPEQAQVLASRVADHRAVLVDYALPRRADC
ncbi:metal-dependent hydrolase [Nocardioides psychrotolerans]|uniref:Metal-dependent hydrolase, endonuclease/exonuclease/phosphatase family n=1 Tax=Nocardioides psychrotolerans TaxID=1005945 RepID=A0A1I3CJS3_9ACTN|nr:endonuclease/exonuclease/phosphatase family protein [Nocardioides psychrotolerans]GEP36778.1 metal-dependent hydrolase [Nocardioides psychrotolerans]SFH74688.1 Metal-dependent hydrolase, endonuclease/exonuclease/phosphatase family [Nocardioides psychrotolerans]